MSNLLPLGTPGANELVPSSQTTQSAPAATEHELYLLWRSIWRRKWLFLGIVAAFVAIVGAITFLTPKAYTTTVRLMAGNSGSEGGGGAGDTALPILNALMFQNGVQTAETLAELAQQENIADSVVKNLNLSASPGYLLSRVEVKPVPNTAILDLSVKWSNPEDSARIANEFAKVFTDVERQYVQSQATSALRFLDAELPRAEARMHDAANRLAQFQAANGFIEAGTQTQQVVTRAGQIDSKIQDLTLDRQSAQALDTDLRTEMSAMPSSDNPALTDEKTKLAQVESQLAIARQQFTERHPEVVALKQQRDALRGEIAAEPRRVQSGEALVNPNPAYQTLAQQEALDKARIDADSANLTQLATARDQLAQAMKTLPQKSVQLASLEQRAKLTTDVYQALQQKHTDATIAQTTALSDVTIISAASAASALRTPSLARNLMIAPIVGLVLATLVVFVLDYFQQKFRDASDVRKVMGLPVIASIPLMESKNRHALPWLQSITVEAFLHLCVSLRMSKRKPLRSLAITSPSIGDGKSTVAFNLAKALSNLQPPILLVDADLRRSVLHTHAQCPNDIGLSEVLSGEHKLEECVHTISPQFDLLSAGQSVPSPIALLQSARFEDFLAEAARRYSITIIDSPALACVADGFAIASHVDGTALVIAANTTDERVAKDVVSHFQALGIDNLVGVVLNKDRQRIHDYSDYFAATFHAALPKGTP